MPLSSTPKPGQGRNDRQTSQLWRLSGMGSELVITILALALVGHLIDRWLGSRPWGLVIGLTVGLLLGGYNFLKQATSVSRKAAADFRAEHPHGLARPHPPEFTAPDDAADDFAAPEDEAWTRDAGDGDDQR